MDGRHATSTSFLQEKAMSVTVDQFCEKLRSRLDGAETRFATLKSNVKALPKQGEQALQNNLDQARSKIEANKKKVAQAQANLKGRAEQKLSQTKEAINEWKVKHETTKLNARADRAEEYAADAVGYAIAMMDQAEEAILDAAVARIDADAAQTPATAAR